MVTVPDTHTTTALSMSPPPSFTSDELSETDFAGFVTEKSEEKYHVLPLSPQPESPTLNIQHQMPLIAPHPVQAMTPTSARTCRTILTSTQRHEAAWPFKQPVDPIAVGAFNYFDVIKSPMDLSTISKRLAHSVYPSLQAYAADFRLMLNNCYLYNPPKHIVNDLGHQLESHIINQFSKHFPAVATPPPQPTLNMEYTGERRTTKRSIRPPKIYEPEDIPIRKHRAVDDELSSDDSKRKRTTRRLSSSSDPDSISNLAAAVQSMADQLAQIQNAAKPAPKPRRRPGTKACKQCGTKVSKVWRSGPLGRATLCEDCGAKYAAAKSKKLLTYEQKLVLADRVARLPADKQVSVFEIISNGQALDPSSAIEIDIETLDAKILRRLFEFVMMQNLDGEVRADKEDSSDSDSDSSGSESD
ncbi:hypothetical protein HK096_005513 [Nowakowskiella sp. JEL0078]|nr:hypothetical protein HK096_005513 [Nowakowskiella sp. JEL0078]